MFIVAPYQTAEQIIYINLDNVVMAQPRLARVGIRGEVKGKNYTSFLLTGLVGNSPTLDTLLEWQKFVEEVTPFETKWQPES